MPKRILLVGAGAIGAFIGSRIATLSKQHVLVSALCRSNYNAVKSNGFTISSPRFGNYVFKPELVFPSAEDARRTTKEKGLTWDYLLIATKVLPEVNDDSALLDGLVNESTSIVLMQNGLGIEEAYRKRFPRTAILSGVTIISTTQSEPGAITHNRWTRTSIGLYIPSPSSLTVDQEQQQLSNDRTTTFVNLLKDSGITDTIQYTPTALQLVRWHKIAINAGINSSSVLTGGCGNRALAIDPETREHLRGVMNEVFSVAPKVLGLEKFPFQELNLATPDQILASVEKNTSGSRPSMWHDWVNGRKMEVEAILGNPIRIAREHGLEMPRVQSLYALLRKAQEKRDEARAESRL